MKRNENCAGPEWVCSAHTHKYLCQCTLCLACCGAFILLAFLFLRVARKSLGM
jgi:hypothetical protein